MVPFWCRPSMLPSADGSCYAAFGNISLHASIVSWRSSQHANGGLPRLPAVPRYTPTKPALPLPAALASRSKNHDRGCDALICDVSGGRLIMAFSYHGAVAVILGAFVAVAGRENFIAFAMAGLANISGSCLWYRWMRVHPRRGIVSACCLRAKIPASIPISPALREYAVGR